MSKRIFVTGMGVMSPLGVGSAATWDGMVNGRSGASPITRFDASAFKTHFACQVPDFDPLNFMDRKEARRMDLFCQFAIASAVEAVEHSGIDFEKVDKDRVGVVYGSGIGGMKTFEDQILKLHGEGPNRVSPLFIPMMIGDIAAGQISIRWGLKGPNYAVQSACSTSTHAIGIAMMHLRAGDCDVVVTGGSEAPVTPAGLGGFNAATTLSTRNDAPETASRPFDLNRDGFVMGEGGVSFVLETEEHMLARGGKPIAEMLGYGFTGDAYHLTAPAPMGEGAVRAMRIALKNAGVQPDEVDYLNAHGTSTELNDKNETAAIKEVFGDHAREMAVSSTKSMTGHLLGAAGALELFASVRATETGVVPPTINYETPDPDCDLNYIPNKAVERDVKIAASNTFGFGGHNATLVVRRVDN